jgi:hypothetical protein
VPARACESRVERAHGIVIGKPEALVLICVSSLPSQKKLAKAMSGGLHIEGVDSIKENF